MDENITHHFMYLIGTYKIVFDSQTVQICTCQMTGLTSVLRRGLCLSYLFLLTQATVIWQE